MYLITGIFSVVKYLNQFALARRLVSWMITHLSFAIPTERLYETEKLIAFYHPKPSYLLHIIILPKKVFPSLMDLGEENMDLFSDVIKAVQILVRKCALEESGYRLIVNGGKYQEVPQLHFHLVSDR